MAWAKQSMCMTPVQEGSTKSINEMYNMSNVHKLIRIDGDHMSFFTPDKIPIVVNALKSILMMTEQI